MQFNFKRANTLKKIQNALISVYSKDGLKEIVDKLNELGINIYSTGGTFDFIREQGVNVTSVESLTGYPSILGGRVKTLHPKVFGGILGRRELEGDLQQLSEYEIPEIDLVIVDLYPFEKTVASGAGEPEIIEKIDIGGISLIRAAAKNFDDVLIISNVGQYKNLLNLLIEKGGESSLQDRKEFAGQAFNISSHYDTAIFKYFNKSQKLPVFKQSILENRTLRYGENPHQKALFFGNLSEVFEQLHGKEVSYNNLIDLDAAINLIAEFSEPTFAILKHNNACGLASRNSLVNAWNDTLAADPISAFGGVLITNQVVDLESAEEINKLFFEIILAPGYENNALEVLKSKKNRIILRKKAFDFPVKQFKSALNGVLVQDKDLKTEIADNFEAVTSTHPSTAEVEDLIFANKIVKHTKSNTIVLVKNKQLIASGVGQTSRVDALKQAILKAETFEFDLKGAVMASDAFFPFADSVEIAHKAGITAVVQPGGSVRDKDSVDFCNEHKMSMVFTGIRHFKH
ncbi:MAG: bifunctional phosphoribosylaminoimidazolecarboxamide formyltransferase/IMP cyclohydrolase PurH [Bacteroidetes bacterium HGW-Bacteroidetes-17]|nr:MAG: bifunctional phosphoribosylaminoimidazolecarboxamide formyltransferase/IMP cyclohydrolase PurH [Bacteroidetes bacterium HGW-Bacteroidetes-17]